MDKVKFVALFVVIAVFRNAIVSRLEIDEFINVVTSDNATNLTLSNTYTNDINTFKNINISGNINITTNGSNTSIMVSTQIE